MYDSCLDAGAEELPGRGGAPAMMPASPLGDRRGERRIMGIRSRVPRTHPK